MRDLLVAFVAAVLCVLGLLTLFDRADRAFDPPLVQADYQRCFTMHVPMPSRNRPVLHPHVSEIS